MNLFKNLRRRSGEARSIGIMTALNLSSGIIAVASTLLIANLFGTSRTVEIYMAAMSLVTLLASITQTGRLSGIFLPIYHQIKKEQGQGAAFGALSVILNWMLVGTAGLCLGLWGLAPHFVRLLVPGFDAEDQAQTITVFRWLLPLVGIIIIRSFLRTQANAESRFGGPEAITVVERLTGTSVMFVLVWDFGLWSLVIGYWAGQLASLVGYLRISYRTGYRYAPKLRQEGFSPWQTVFNKMPHTMSYVSSEQLFSFVMTAALSVLPSGSLALYKYIEGIYSKVSAILLNPISVVYFTNLSNYITQGRRHLRDQTEIALARYLLIWGGLIAVVLAASRLILRALWGVQKFSEAEISLASNLLKVLFMLVLVEMLVWVLENANLAMQDSKRMFGSKTVVQFASAAAAWFLIPAFGITGAVAAIGVRATGFALASGLLIWDREHLIILHPMNRLWRWGVAVLVGVGTAGMLASLTSFFEVDARIISLAYATFLGGVSALVTYAIAWGLRVPEIRLVVQRLVVRRGRLSTSVSP